MALTTSTHVCTAVVTTYSKPTKCSTCDNYLIGLYRQGFHCIGCNKNYCHKECVPMAATQEGTTLEEGGETKSETSTETVCYSCKSAPSGFKSLRPCVVCRHGMCESCVPHFHRLPQPQMKSLKTSSGVTDNRLSILNPDTINDSKCFVCEACVHAMFEPPIDAVITTPKPTTTTSTTTTLTTTSPTSNNAEGPTSYSNELADKYARMCAFAYSHDSRPNEDKHNDLLQQFECTLVAWRTFKDETSFYICKDDATIFVVYRGTDNMKNVVTDANLTMSKFPTFGQVFAGSKVHTGFVKSYYSSRLELLNLMRVLLEDPNNKDHNIIITGHSLGGALASIASLDMAATLGVVGISRYKRLSSFTYGSPRVGNIKFAEAYNAIIPNTFRIANTNDVIPKLPTRTNLFPYKHVGNYVRVDRDGPVNLNPERRSKLLIDTNAIRFGASEHISYFSASFPSSPF